MNVDHYTPIHLHKKNFNLSLFFSTHFEPLLLSLVVLTGIIGSIYLFGQNLVSSSNNYPENNGNKSISTALAVAILGTDESISATNDFKKYVKMEGKIEAGKDFFFDFLQDETAARYYMEMGDGVRLIVTQKELLYQYAAPGKYTIELKESKNGLLQLIGTKTVKVK